MSVRIKWNIRAFHKLRRDPGVKKKLKDEADDLARAAGSGYVAEDGPGRTRHRASVSTGDAESRRDNSENNTLLRKLKGV